MKYVVLRNKDHFYDEYFSGYCSEHLSEAISMWKDLNDRANTRYSNDKGSGHSVEELKKNHMYYNDYFYIKLIVEE